MKIVQILPELTSGGVERGTLEISRALVAQGHESIVISHGGPLVKTLEGEGGRHILMPVHRKSLMSLSQVRPLRNLLAEENIDLIHARSRVPAWISYLAWKGMHQKTRPRFLTTFHGFHSVSPYSEIMAKGERVIAVSESVKAHIKDHYPKTDLSLVTVIHRGVSDDDYQLGYTPAENAEALKLRRECPDSFILTLPGRVTGWKGGKDFLEIISALKERGIPVNGWFAGGVHAKRNSFSEELQSMVSALDLTDDVKFLGQRNDLKDIMAVSDAVLSLSTKPEAFGRVSLEALRIGVPVAGYDHGGVAEQLSALFPEGKIPLGDTAACVDLLEAWYKKRPSVLDQENPFSLEKMQASVLSVYEEMVRE